MCFNYDPEKEGFSLNVDYSVRIINSMLTALLSTPTQSMNDSLSIKENNFLLSKVIDYLTGFLI
jgi:hypothetical protein